MVPISDIIARTRKAVERILGSAQKTQAVKISGPLASLKAYYHNGEIEIIYIDNVADWIMIHNKANRPIEEFIHYFGLTDLTPQFYFRGTVSQINIAGLKEIKTVTIGGIPQMVHIKAFTE